MAGTRNYDFLVRSLRLYLSILPPSIHNVLFTIPSHALTLYADQTPPYRRLRRRQILLSLTLQRRQLHALLHHNDRHRLQDPHHRPRRQTGQITDMGYGGTGTIPDNHNSLLPRRNGDTARI